MGQVIFQTVPQSQNEYNLSRGSQAEQKENPSLTLSTKDRAMAGSYLFYDDRYVLDRQLPSSNALHRPSREARCQRMAYVLVWGSCRISAVEFPIETLSLWRANPLMRCLGS